MPHARITPASQRISTNPIPYSERLRRRTIESRQSRIRRTIFRLPQVAAQAEADRRASLTSTSEEPSPTTEIPSAVEQDESSKQEPEVEPNTQQPTDIPTPQTPQRRWSIRGLINSVPRSFTRILPGWGASARGPEASGKSCILAKLYVRGLQIAEIPQPSSERTSRKTLSGVSGTRETHDKQTRRLSDQQPAIRQESKQASPRDLSYSLFPAPLDRKRYLGITSDTSKKASVSQDVHSVVGNDVVSETEATTVPPHPPTEVVEESEISPQQETETPRVRKRKRLPSPDVIPNPPGTSYGMDLRYFGYSSSESEEELEETSPPIKRPRTVHGVAARSALRSEAATWRKKVRFDASPEDTPSKLRTKARATDPYRGRHFIGMGNDSNATITPASPSTPTPTAYADITQRPGFVPNTEGTYKLDYDAFSDDSDSSGPPSPGSVLTPRAESGVDAEAKSKEQEPKQ